MSKPPALLLFDSFFDSASELTGDEFKAVVVALHEYNRDGTEPTFTDRTMRSAFKTGKSVIDGNHNEWERKTTLAKELAQRRWQKQQGDNANACEGMPTNAKACEGMHTHTNDANACIPIPMPMPTPKPTPMPKPEPMPNSSLSNAKGVGVHRSKLTTRKSTAELKQAYGKAYTFWEAVRAVYPSNRRHVPAEGTLQLIEKEGLCERQDEIVAKVKLFTETDDEWKRGYAPRMSKFFDEGRYDSDPTPPKPPETIHRVVTNQAPMPSYTDTSDTPQF